MIAATMRIALAAALAATAAGCGAPSPDLFSVDRTGRTGDRNATLTLVVNDGGSVTCNGTITKTLAADDLLAARQLARDLAELAELGVALPPGAGSLLSYKVATDAGNVSFADTSADRAPALDRLQAFVKRVAERVCGLER